MISFSCSENKTEDNVSLTSPIPTIPSEVKNDTPDGVKNKADENEDPLLDKIPSYIAIEYNIADSINIKEGESKKFILGLNAFNKYNIKLDKDLFLYNLDIRCSSPCPDGISLDDDGNINFSASYDDEGEFEVSLIANIRGFNIENTFGPINVKVFHTNQRPEILDIKLISLDVPINGSLIPHFSCDVIRKDNDNDRLKTFYEWYANNVQLDSSKNIDFNKSIILFQV